MNLFHFIDWVMRLPSDLEHQLREEIIQMEMRQAKPYVSVIERLAQEEGRREGREEGREEGRKEGQVDLLLHLLTHRFGAAATTIRPRLQTLTIAQIESLVDVALAQATLDAFVEQLPPPAVTLSTGTAQ